MKKIRFFKNDESGVVLVFVVIAMVALLSFTSFAVDMGLAYYQKSQLQAACDSAALAAAHDMPDAIIATATAKEYIEKNGFKAIDVRVTFDATNFTCRVYCKSEMKTFFANMFNVSKVDMAASAASKLFKGQGNHSAVYDYCIFAGGEDQTLNLGAKFDVHGSVHSNGLFYLSPQSGQGHIYGNLEAANGGELNYTNDGWPGADKIVLGTVNKYSHVIEMPDFTSCVEQTIPSTYDRIIFGGTEKKPAKFGFTAYNGNVMINGSANFSNGLVINGNLYVRGNLEIGGNGPALILNNGTIYCTGSIKSTSSSSIYGCVFADGDVTLQGGSNWFIPTASVAIYSKNGNITMSASNTEIYGIVYAPNGSLSITGNNLEFYGNLIAKYITGIPAYLSVGENTFDLPFDIGSEGSIYAALVE